MNKFKAGDKVRCYSYLTSPEVGLVKEIRGCYLVITTDNNPHCKVSLHAHYKQCRKIKPKAQAREFYVRITRKECEDRIGDMHFTENEHTVNHYADGDWIHVREIK